MTRKSQNRKIVSLLFVTYHGCRLIQPRSVHNEKLSRLNNEQKNWAPTTIHYNRYQTKTMQISPNPKQPSTTDTPRAAWSAQYNQNGSSSTSLGFTIINFKSHRVAIGSTVHRTSQTYAQPSTHSGAKAHYSLLSSRATYVTYRK